MQYSRTPWVIHSLATMKRFLVALGEAEGLDGLGSSQVAAIFKV